VYARPVDRSALDHAVRLVHRVCCLAGSADFVAETRTDHRALRSAIKARDTPALFDWLIATLSYQGISDRVAHDYMDQHGCVTWREIEQGLANGPACPKLASYWQFHGCRYHKTSGTCAEPDHIAECPLPTHVLRNGRLNQTAYSLFLFIRDIAGSDLVRWVDVQLVSAAGDNDAARPGRMREALLDPLRHVYGVSDKVLSMALSVLLMAAPKKMWRWSEVGAAMVAVDTLVHNFLVRTGILRRFNADHAYGTGLLPAWRVCRHHRGGRRANRCQRVQLAVSKSFPAVRAARDLAVLRRERPRRVQRQPHQG